MSQVTIYINNDLEKRVKAMAGNLDVSLSKLISGILEEKFNNEWDSSVKQLVGSWENFPSVDEIRETIAQDVKRESF